MRSRTNAAKRWKSATTEAFAEASDSAESPRRSLAKNAPAALSAASLTEASGEVTERSRVPPPPTMGVDREAAPSRAALTKASNSLAARPSRSCWLATVSAAETARGLAASRVRKRLLRREASASREELGVCCSAEEAPVSVSASGVALRPLPDPPNSTRFFERDPFFVKAEAGAAAPFL